MAGNSSVMAELTSLMASILSRNLPRPRRSCEAPLALPNEKLLLHLDGAMHPSFGNSVLAFFSMTVKGSSVKPTISQKEWEDLAARMEAYGAWLEAKPNEGVCSLGKRFGEGEFTAATVETLRQLIQKDLAMAKKAESLKELRSLIFLKRDFLRILAIS